MWVHPCLCTYLYRKKKQKKETRHRIKMSNSRIATGFKLILKDQRKKVHESLQVRHLSSRAGRMQNFP